MNNKTCFFCYAWGTEERYQRLTYLKKTIEKKTDRGIEVILDRHTYKDNQDLDELLKRINQYDLVVIFFTPDFKQIILDPNANVNKDREVLKEYEVVSIRNKKNPNSVFPVIFEGTKETSLPELFGRRCSTVFDELRLTRNQKGRYVIPRENRDGFTTFINEVIHTTIYNNLSQSIEYRTAREAMDKLFNLTNTTELPDYCLVIPDLYDYVLRQEYYFIVGRKGSGKSTFINNFPKMNKKMFENNYKHMYPLSAEEFQYDYAFDTLIWKHYKELSYWDLHTRLCLFWQVYFMLQCVVTIAGEIENRSISAKTVGNKRFNAFNRVVRTYKSRIGLRVGKSRSSYHTIKSDVVPSATFRAAVEMIDEQFVAAIRDTDEDSLLLTSVVANLSAQAVLENAFGQEKISDFMNALRACQKKIIISVDCFDTHSADFRRRYEQLPRNSEEYIAHREYDQYFLRTLVEVVTKFKDKAYRDDVAGTLGNYLDFCIVLPRDRYDEIITTDRDSFKKRFGFMGWSALELLKILTLRLEYLVSRIEGKNPNSIIENSDNYFERMDVALSFFRGLPKSMKMNVQGNIMRMSLYKYILRSSFWRPRDVISNLSCLLSCVVRFDSNNEPHLSNRELSEDEVKLVIKDNARKLIKEEFIEEYEGVFYNLHDVLASFYASDEQMDIDSFMTKLNSITFETSYAYDMSVVEEKLRVLYQLGVIGLRFEPAIAERLNYQNNICFEFNEGMIPLEKYIDYASSRQMGRVNVIMNPIFARELMLNYNTPYLLGNWTDEYIVKSDAMKRRWREAPVF